MDDDDSQVQTILRACRDCGDRFAIGPGEQRFFARQGYELPSRCIFCRRARKLARAYLGAAHETRRS
jgi:hypothetical protein